MNHSPQTLDIEDLIQIGTDLVEQGGSPESAAKYIEAHKISGDTIAELARRYAMEAKGVRPLAHVIRTIDEHYFANALLSREDEDDLAKYEAAYLNRVGK